jgi:hypothetical protein
MSPNGIQNQKYDQKGEEIEKNWTKNSIKNQAF